ncbi:MAG: glycoside hydrolase family 32 protein [bacterium]
MADEKLEELRGRTYPDALEDQLKALETDEDLQRFRESRERLAVDPYRPLYHFSPPENSMNDPNGLCQWQGRYHLFYQFVPQGQRRVHWGHTISDDLVNWRDMPPALYPDKEEHCFSGQTVVESDRVVAIYHGTKSGNSIATASDPLLLNWKKHPNNPVIPIVPIDENGAPYRVFDPCIWKEDDGYYSVSGTYKDGNIHAECRGVDHLFRSRDLAEWEYLGPLVEGGFFTEPGEDHAVPNFWPIGNGKHMLLFFSHKRAGQYYVGDYDQASHRFTPDYHGRQNYGSFTIGSLHAPSATIDENGRFLGLFNVKEGKERKEWNDVMTLPRVYSLAADNSMRIKPAGEVRFLRSNRQEYGSVDIPANGEVVLEKIRGKAMEIEAVIEPGAAREVGLCVLRSLDASEYTRISLYQNDDRRLDLSSLQIDISSASLRSDVSARSPERGPVKIEENEPIHFNVFIDRSIIEVFANGRQCLTIRVYPDRENSNGVSVFARGSKAKLLSLDAWQMRSIWPELKGYEGK